MSLQPHPLPHSLEEYDPQETDPPEKGATSPSSALDPATSSSDQRWVPRLAASQVVGSMEMSAANGRGFHENASNRQAA